MTKRVQAKHKIDRRLGVNLWGRPKSPINVRNQGPGQHGARRSKPSDFGIQLRAKQKLKGYYANITERQFRKIYAEAERRRGDTGENLVGLLESRLDALVYRMKFVPTMFAARQLVSHGHVEVNGKPVNISSYMVREGDEIQIREKSRKMDHISFALQSTEREVPEYITVDEKAMKGSYVRVPKLADVPYPVQMEPQLVIEFYSR